MIKGGRFTQRRDWSINFYEILGSLAKPSIYADNCHGTYSSNPSTLHKFDNEKMRMLQQDSILYNVIKFVLIKYVAGKSIVYM